MKKLLSIAIILFSQHLVAQEDRLAVRLIGGIAMPQGDFGESTSSIDAGFAKNGVIGGLGLGIPLAKNVVLDIDLVRASYKVDKDNFFRLFQSQLQQQFPGNTLQSSINIGNYTNTNAFASLRLMTGSNGIFIYAKPGIGASWLNVPSVTVNLTSGLDQFTIITSYQSSVTLMFNLAAGLLFELSDNVSLDLGGQYLFSSFDVTASTYAEDNSGNTQRSSTSGDVNFSSLNLTVGFLFYINKGE